MEFIQRELVGGRIALHRAMTRFGGVDVLYCDTDGFYSTRGNHPVGDDLGMLRLDSQGDGLHIFVRAQSKIFNGKVTWKGIPKKNLREIESKIAGDSEEFRVDQLLAFLSENQIQIEVERIIHPRVKP